MNMDAETFDLVMQEAIAEEVAAAEFYAQAARRMKDAGARSIFEQLSTDELHHRNILETFRFNPLARIEFGHAPDYRVAEKEKQPPLSFEMSPKEAFQLAMKKEEQAMGIYTEMAEGCKNPETRKLYLQLAEMERGHKARLEELFINAAYPEAW